jgi:hypothetical protein
LSCHYSFHWLNFAKSTSPKNHYSFIQVLPGIAFGQFQQDTS